MIDDRASEDPNQFRTKTSLAALVMATASLLTGAVQQPQEATYLIWKRALRDADDALVFESVFNFRKQLSRLANQINSLEFFASDTKNFYLETVDGMHESTDLPRLMNSWSRHGHFFEGEKLSRLTAVRDILKQSSPVGIPTIKGVELLSEKLSVLYSILEESVDIPDPLKIMLRSRLDAVKSALARIDMFGSEVVVSAAGQLAGDVVVVLHAEGGPAPMSKDANFLRRFAAASLELVDTAGRISFLWDATKFAIENAEKIPTILQNLK